MQWVNSREQTRVNSRERSGFVAIRHEDAARFSPAYDLLQRAQGYAESTTLDPDWKEYYVESMVAIIDGLRGMYELYGKLYF